MAKYKKGDKLICIPFDSGLYRSTDEKRGGAGYILDRIITVETITVCNDDKATVY